MIRALLYILTAFVLSINLHGEENLSIALARSEAKKAGVSVSEIENGIKNTLLNLDNSVLAVTFAKAHETLCLIVFQNEHKDLISVDVSAVESGNFGKLGYDRSYYQKYITRPVEWIVREDDLIRIKFVTQAWKNGQRYTVSEPVIVKSDGTPLFR